MTRRFLVGGITAVLILAFAGELNSEYVNLTTYYPAPSGVYTQMLTTGKAFLAQSANTGVAVGWGAASFPGGSSLKLSVAGSLAVGVGGTSDLTFKNAALDAAQNPSDIVVQGRVGIGTTRVDNGVSPDGIGNGLMVKGRLRVGTNTGYSAGEALERGRSYIYIDNIDSQCAATPISGNNVANICAAGDYATFIAGFYINGWFFQNRGGQVVASYGPGALQYTSYVRGMDGGGNETWTTLGKSDNNLMVYCCPK
ncbi:MAG: hypothetical protein HY748_06590 [Elusimicrobia bacterium]|nr:hypothetical protein [Elusimicrobiota bacterium]